MAVLLIDNGAAVDYVNTVRLLYVHDEATWCGTEWCAQFRVRWGMLYACIVITV